MSWDEEVGLREDDDSKLLLGSKLLQLMLRCNEKKWETAITSKGKRGDLLRVGHIT